ncbi:hypothetical protein [Aquimarina macrocephali]|uniref:hypothetical protein n=1 Tax=Aquimarina macrocephali TaxID=666563 RepID=UPI0004671AF0|nr:hypothetical protein [Aquimarina macrocephali]
MDERLNSIISEIREKCKKANCTEFEYYWEYYGLLWYPWSLEINDRSESFTCNDISYRDLEELCSEGLIELVKEYSKDEMGDEYDRKRYRIIDNIQHF